MTDVHNLSRQHKEIQELLVKLNAFSTKEAIENASFNISLLIGHLSGKINIHLSNEDKYVYPKLKESADAKTRQVSEIFSREMGGLTNLFADFKSKYMSSTKIVANSSTFLDELHQLTRSINKRIEKEEAELYPLLTR
ncbi:MAG: Hemerythrin cation binding domain protein [Sporomusa sp.]|jgi:hemerythrin-like domain-containing protein|nr:Hemerythrin cation binding domain protein [Sporomusa sp.]